ncbi:hypothetical protein niasHT_039647 [Heterodera trifolii]|uniref:Glyoxylate reductase/hydroxypyruvate reductase n=1 Tax=Heterodera trifolii TaxID=157864 RepID=A0ABD2I9J7_9BILA
MSDCPSFVPPLVSPSVSPPFPRSLPLVLVTEPTFEVSRIEQHALVLQFRPQNDGFFSENEQQKWVKEHIGKAEIIYTMAPLKVDASLLEVAKALKAVVTISAGHENIDTVECARRGILMGFGGAILTEATAETAVALLLAVSRRLVEAVQIAKEGKWPNNWSPKFCVGKALEGSTVGIFGMGRIGRSIAEKLSAFRPLEIIYHNRKANSEYEGRFRYVPFEELIERSDFLILSASVNDQTKGLFDKEKFERMKSDAILVNIGRGCLVKTDDLYEALNGRKLGGAALDVTEPEPLPAEHPLFSLPNCVITPHIGSANGVARKRMMEMGQANVIAALKGEEMPSPIRY